MTISGFWRFVWLAIGLSFVSGSPLADQPVPVVPVPDWVRMKSPDLSAEIPESEVSNGVYYLLVDNQVKAETESRSEYFFHFAELVVNQNGLEKSSQLNISYDPGYESLSIHKILIWRNGNAIDKYKSARVSLITREENLEKLIYSGKQNVNIILDDIRVGDTIEYSFTIKGDNPVFQDIFAYSYPLSWGVSVYQLYVRVLWNKDKPLNYKIINDKVAPGRKKTSAGDEYWIEKYNISSLLLDSDVPDWFDPFGAVYFSEVSSWKEVVDWATPLFEKAVSIEGAINNVASDILNSYQKTEDRIAAAIRYVQEEVRYLGIEIGQNSHKPFSANETLERRYGDCKDKTVLLISILNAIGEKAYPALVNTRNYREIEKMLPAINLFDHVILNLPYGGKNYWFDPTRAFQYGGLEDIYQPNYGYALVLKADSADLTEVKTDNSNTKLLVRDYFDLSSGSDGDVSYTAHSEYSGSSAEYQRSNMAVQGLKKLEKSYLDFYAGYYPKIKRAGSIEFDDMRDSNRVVIRENYNISDFWQKDDEKRRYLAWFYANAMLEYLKKPEQEERRHPLAISYPKDISQSLEIKLDAGGWQFDKSDFVEENDYFTFTSSVRYSEQDNVLKLDYSYKSHSRFVPVKDMAKYVDAIKAVNDQTSYGIFTGYDGVTGAQAQKDSGDRLMYGLIAGYLTLIILTIILWRIDIKRNPYIGEMLYFPISPIKLLPLWVITFGFYGLYWFYRNWKYVKNRDGSSIMPAIRAFFFGFWYYPLFKDLVKDNDARYDKNHLPNNASGIVLALVFLIAVVSSNKSAYSMLFLCLSVLTIIPLQNYINYVNKENQEAIKYNSRWNIRHYMVVLLTVPLFLLNIGGEIGFLPNDEVVDGRRLMSHDLRFMQRYGIIKPGDSINYFYSNAFLFIRDDGNGFTDRHVFSYWKDETGALVYKLADFSEIEDIKVNWAGGWNDNTVVTVVRNDQSDFLLYVSNAERKDRVFVRELKRRWNNKNKQDKER